MKDLDAYRTISEVAEALEIPPHVLRFWETKFPQVQPLKRGGGRRFYRPTDVDLLRTIRRLLYDDGYTIRGVQRLLKTRGVSGVLALPPGPASLPAEMPRFDDLPILPDDDPARRVLEHVAAEIAACRVLLADALRAAPPAERPDI